MSDYDKTEESTVKRIPMFASYDKDLIHSLIDASPYCHVSALVDDSPYIQPTVHWRDGENLYIHGAKKNKMVYALRKGAKAALAFTHFDGYILTRSAFAHGVVYRSVTLFGTAREIDDLDEKRSVLRLFVERVSPGRWEALRPPTVEELKMTGLLQFTIANVSAKVAMQGKQVLSVLPGGEYEDAADQAFHPWTGLYPYALIKASPVSTQELIEQFTVSSVG